MASCGIIILCTLTLSGVNAIFFEEQKESTGLIEIVSLNRDSTLNGSFVLGSGFFNEQHQYVYFAKRTNDNGLVKGFKSVNNSIIYEQDLGKKSPHIVWEVTTSRIKPEYRLWGINFILADSYSNYRFYVPKNTVIKEFNL